MTAFYEKVHLCITIHPEPIFAKNGESLINTEF